MKEIQTKHVLLKEYVTGFNRDEVDYILKYGDIEPNDLFNIGELTERSFGFVKDVQNHLVYSGLTWVKYIEFLIQHLKLTEQDIYDESIYKLQSSRLWIREQVEAVNELERIGLSHLPTQEEEAADLSRFNKYRSYPQLRSLTDGDVLKNDLIRAKKYMDCFTELMYRADSSQFEKDLNNIYRRKQNG